MDKKDEAIIISYSLYRLKFFDSAVTATKRKQWRSLCSPRRALYREAIGGMGSTVNSKHNDTQVKKIKSITAGNVGYANRVANLSYCIITLRYVVLNYITP